MPIDKPNEVPKPNFKKVSFWILIIIFGSIGFFLSLSTGFDVGMLLPLACFVLFALIGVPIWAAVYVIIKIIKAIIDYIKNRSP